MANRMLKQPLFDATLRDLLAQRTVLACRAANAIQAALQSLLPDRTRFLAWRHKCAKDALRARTRRAMRRA